VGDGHVRKLAEEGKLDGAQDRLLDAGTDHASPWARINTAALSS